MRKKTPSKLLKNAPKNVSSFTRKYCGKRIGGGAHRIVYIFKPDDRFVVKIERSMKYKWFSNVNEWSNWEWNKHWDTFANWLAPCEWISECGRILIQRRVERIVDGGSSKYPKRIPAFLTDTKYFNFGWLDGTLVCFDYPNLIMGDFKLKNVRWWGKKK